MQGRPGLLSRAAQAGARALGFVPGPPSATPSGTTTDAAPPGPGPTVRGGVIRRVARAVADSVNDLFAGKFFEGQEHASAQTVLEGGWQPRPGYSDFILEILGRTGLARRILALRALDATREGWAVRFPTLKPDEAAKAAGRLTQQQKDLGVQAAIYRGLFKAEQYGEAIVVIGADDGLPMDQPLDMARVRKVWWLKIFARPDYQPGPLSGPTGPSAGNFDLPEYYDLFDFTKPSLSSLERAQREPMQVRVHHTRVLRFNTEDGVSRLDEVAEALEGYMSSVRAARKAANVFSVAKFAIQDWIAKVIADEDEAVARIALQKLGLKQLGAIIVDKEREDYTYQGSPGATAVPGIVDRSAIDLCAWTGYPAMVLLGMDPSGFSTGEEVIRRYYDTVRVMQKLQIERPLRYLLSILMVSQDGPAGISVAPEDWVVWFAPLRTLTAKEQADLREVVYRGVVSLKTAQVIDREEARNTLTRDDGELVPNLQVSKNVAADQPRERLEVGIIGALNSAVIEFYKARNLPPPAAAEQALFAAVVPEITEAVKSIFVDESAGDLVDPATGLPRQADELADEAPGPAPTPGVPPPGESTIEARDVKDRYGVTLATLKRWIAEGRLRAWRSGGDRGRWRVLESEVAALAMHQPPGQSVGAAGVEAAPSGTATEVTGAGEGG